MERNSTGRETLRTNHHGQADSRRDWVVFAVLVAFGVIARWAQPNWNFTPLAAVSIFAGYYFANRAFALATPIAVLAISNLLLPAYAGYAVMAACYGMFLLPVWLGTQLRGRETYLRLAACGVVPAVFFYLVTNFLVWQTHSTYEPTLAGLLDCYVQALPFFRLMLTGDLLYLAVVFGSYAGIVEWERRQLEKRLVRVPVRRR